MATPLPADLRPWVFFDVFYSWDCGFEGLGGWGGGVLDERFMIPKANVPNHATVPFGASLQVSGVLLSHSSPSPAVRFPFALASIRDLLIVMVETCAVSWFNS